MLELFEDAVAITKTLSERMVRGKQMAEDECLITMLEKHRSLRTKTCNKNVPEIQHMDSVIH